MLLICQFNFVRNGKTFNRPENPPSIPNWSPLIFPNLQRDSCRCYLLLMCIFVRAYLSKAVEDQKKGKFEKSKVAAYVVDKLQKMNFGISMLQNNDFHVHQIGIVLQDCQVTYKAVLEEAGIASDFKYLTEFMTAQQNKGLPIDKSKLSQASQAIPDFNAPGVAENHLPADFLKTVKTIDARTIADWTSYKLFSRIFKKSDLSTAG